MTLAWDFLASPVIGSSLPVMNRVPRIAIPWDTRRWICERDGWQCRLCGASAWPGGHLDHVKPRSSYPPEAVHEADWSANLQLLCAPCNGEKSTRLYAMEPPLPVAEGCCICEAAWVRSCLNDGWPVHPVPAFCGPCGVVDYAPGGSWLR